jgi:hypothetical protein
MLVSRTGSYLDLLVWLILSSGWWVGGWLIAAHVYRLRHRERFFAGGAIGFLLFILTSNFLAHWVSLEAAYWAAAVLILGTGALAARRWPAGQRWSFWRDLRAAPNLLAFAGLFTLFSLINFGLAILDDYANLPLVSMISTGQVPPQFYLNPEIGLDYHYGLHLFAANLVRMGGFFPWTAFDLSKALTTALTLMLAWLWYRRYINRGWGVLLGVLLVLFGSGTRWLLLFVPQQTLLEMGRGLELLGSAAHSGSDLYSALISPWRIEGGGPIPFPFAFANGIFPPMLGLGSNGSIPQMSLFLLLILACKRWRPVQGLIFGLLVASLSLTTELVFAMVWSGILLAVVIRLWLDRSGRNALQWGWVLIPAILLALASGSAISELVRRFTQPAGAAAGTVALPAITFYWPPAFISAHLGPLSLLDLNQVWIALAEMGPVLLLGPFVTYLSIGYLRSRKLVMAGLCLAAAATFLLPLFIRFTDRERDLARMLSTALTIWLVIGYLYVWRVLHKGKAPAKALAAIGVGLTLFGGIALFPPQMVSIAAPQPSYFIGEPDALMAKAYWDRLDENAQILDLAYLYRPPTLFGRSAGRAYQSVYIALPEFKELVADPKVDKIADYGYSYVYFDRETWQGLAPEQRQSFQQPCVVKVEEYRIPEGDYRRLLDIRKCGVQAGNTSGAASPGSENHP